jgi:hypothetical protein
MAVDAVGEHEARAAARAGRLKSRYFEITLAAEGVLICYRHIVADPFGRRIGSSEVRHRMTLRLKHLGGVQSPMAEAAIEIPFSAERAAAVARAIEILDGDIDALKRKPLTPKTVKSVLGITGVERVRWSRDGRLPAMEDPSFFGSGCRSVPFHTYRPETIATLMADPRILATWREIDARQAMGKDSMAGPSLDPDEQGDPAKEDRMPPAGGKAP